MPPDIATLLAGAGTRLAAVSDAPGLEAELLLARALDKPRTHLRAWPERRPGDTRQRRFEALLDRRLGGEPLAYILGSREFWSLELRVTPATLIPRPDTERLVELALERLPARPVRVADLGTGSGAVALALAAERPRARVSATDLSAEALAVARDNACRLGLDNVDFTRGHWCQALVGRYELIVSNPPYVPAGDPHLSRGDPRFEPLQALAAGADGLEAIRAIAAGAPAALAPGGWLLLEHGWDQGAAVRRLLRGRGFAEVFTSRDLAGRERVSGGRRQQFSF